MSIHQPPVAPCSFSLLILFYSVDCSLLKEDILLQLLVNAFSMLVNITMLQTQFQSNVDVYDQQYA